MFLKKVLNQPNVVGTLMIALLFGAGFVYAFAIDGFNVQTVTDGEVEAWLTAADGGNSGEDTITCSPRGTGAGGNNLHCRRFVNGKEDGECPGKCSTGNKCNWKGCHGKK